MQRQGGKGCESICPENQWGQEERGRDGGREEVLKCGERSQGSAEWLTPCRMHMLTVCPQPMPAPILPLFVGCLGGPHCLVPHITQDRKQLSPQP